MTAGEPPGGPGPIAAPGAAGPESPVPRARAAAPAAPPDPAQLAAAVRALPRAGGQYGPGVTLGPPSVDALVGATRQTFVWIDGDGVHALGARADELAGQLTGFTLTPPAWLAAWLDATAPGANPWRVPGHADPAIAALLARAAARWAAPEQARVRAALARDDGGGRWAMVADPEPLLALLAWWATRDVAAGGPLALPFALDRMRRGPLFERAPRAAALSLDVLGDAGGPGALRLRAIAMRDAPHGFMAVQGGVVDGGDVVLAMQPVAATARQP